MRVALFGGSFNPPHIGHQLAALYILETEPVDALWFVPCFKHPFDKHLESFEDRWQMCQLMAAALGSRVQVSDVEKKLGGESRTLRTVKALQEAHAEAEFVLVVGADLEAEIDTWYGADELRRAVRFLFVGRSGYGEKNLPMPAVSSTDVRGRLQRGESVAGLMPRSVLAYIRQKTLYDFKESR